MTQRIYGRITLNTNLPVPLPPWDRCVASCFFDIVPLATLLLGLFSRSFVWALSAYFVWCILVWTLSTHTMSPLQLRKRPSYSCYLVAHHHKLWYHYVGEIIPLGKLQLTQKNKAYGFGLSYVLFISQHLYLFSIRDFPHTYIHNILLIFWHFFLIMPPSNDISSDIPIAI